MSAITPVSLSPITSVKPEINVLMCLSIFELKMLRIKYAVHIQCLMQQTKQLIIIIIIINSHCHLAQILYDQSAARNMDYVKCTVQI